MSIKEVKKYIDTRIDFLALTLDTPFGTKISFVQLPTTWLPLFFIYVHEQNLNNIINIFSLF